MLFLSCSYTSLLYYLWIMLQNSLRAGGMTDIDSTYSSSSGGIGSSLSVVYPPAEPKSSAPGFVGSTGIGETEKSLTNISGDTFPAMLARPRVDGCMPRAEAISCTRAIPSDVRQDLRRRMAMFIEALVISPHCKRAACMRSVRAHDQEELQEFPHSPESMVMP
jgi:hypothetical protein